VSLDKVLHALQWALAWVFLTACAQLVIAILRVINLWRDNL